MKHHFMHHHFFFNTLACRNNCKIDCSASAYPAYFRLLRPMRTKSKPSFRSNWWSRYTSFIRRRQRLRSTAQPIFSPSQNQCGSVALATAAGRIKRRGDWHTTSRGGIRAGIRDFYTAVALSLVHTYIIVLVMLEKQKNSTCRNFSVYLVIIKQRVFFCLSCVFFLKPCGRP